MTTFFFCKRVSVPLEKKITALSTRKSRLDKQRRSSPPSTLFVYLLTTTTAWYIRLEEKRNSVCVDVPTVSRRFLDRRILPLKKKKFFADWKERNKKKSFVSSFNLRDKAALLLKIVSFLESRLVGTSLSVETHGRLLMKKTHTLLSSSHDNTIETHLMRWKEAFWRKYFKN